MSTPSSGRHDDGADVGVAGDAPLEGAQRHQHDVVLIGAEAGLRPCASSRPITSQETLLDAEPLADRVRGAEQLLAHRLADDADRAAAAHLAVEEVAARRQAPSPA